MGGGLTSKLGADRPDAVGAVVDCYGLYAWDEGAPDYAALGRRADPLRGERRVGRRPRRRRRSPRRHVGARVGREVELFVYEGVDHAFANEERPRSTTRPPATLLFERSTAFFSKHL